MCFDCSTGRAAEMRRRRDARRVPAVGEVQPACQPSEGSAAGVPGAVGSLAAGATVDVPSAKGARPLAFAANLGHTAVVRLLLAAVLAEASSSAGDTNSSSGGNGSAATAARVPLANTTARATS